MGFREIIKNWAFLTLLSGLIISLVGNFAIDPSLVPRDYVFSVDTTNCGGAINNFHLDIDVKGKEATLEFDLTCDSVLQRIDVYFPEKLEFEKIDVGPSPKMIGVSVLTWHSFEGPLDEKFRIKFKGEVIPNGFFQLVGNVENVYSGYYDYSEERIKLKMGSDYALQEIPQVLSSDSEIFSFNSEEGEIVYVKTEDSEKNLQFTIKSINLSKTDLQNNIKDLGASIMFVALGVLIGQKTRGKGT